MKRGFFFFWSPKDSLDTAPCFHFESRKIFIQMEKEKKNVLINILESFYTIILTFRNALSLTSPCM